MGIREKINANCGVVSGIVVAIALLSLMVGWLNTRDVSTEIAKQMYYSDDDGKTYFVDDTTKVYPYDHNGKKAYRAYVFKGKGEPFVGMLARYNDSVRAEILNLQSKTDSGSRTRLTELQQAIEVKKPGDSEWVPTSSAKGQAIQMVKSPDGNELHGISP